MKVEISADGTLIVTGENPTECFALSHWQRLWEEHSATLMIQTVAMREGRLRDGLEKVLAPSIQRAG